MAKSLRVLLFIALIVIPIFFYKTLNRKSNVNRQALSFSAGSQSFRRPKIALIFDDLGESLKRFKENIFSGYTTYNFSNTKFKILKEYCSHSITLWLFGFYSLTA